MSQEEKIKQIQAEGKKLFAPAKIVARKLGDCYPKKHGANYVLTFTHRAKPIAVSWDSYAPNLSVYYDDNKVLCFHLGDITHFIKGAWVKPLLKLAAPLLAQEKAEKREEQKQRKRERIARWGLTN